MIDPMTTKLLQEASAVSPSKVGNRWRGILAVPGQGSSGYYSEEVLRTYGPAAIAPGAKAFINHDEERNPKDMIGVYPDGAYYEEGVGLVGELEVFPHWKDFVEAVGPHAGLSIYMMGESDADGNVTALIESPTNGIDLVSYPGLAGSGLVEKLYESAHKTSAEAEPGTTVADTQKKEAKVMDELTKLVEALALKVDEKFSALEAKVDSIVTLSESAADAEAEKLEALEVAEALANAELTDKGRKRVLESVKVGGTIAEAIADEKAYRDEVLAESKALHEGRFGGNSETHDFRVAGLKVG